MERLNEQLTMVEIWNVDRGEWEEYDCPEGNTVGDYAKWCINEDSKYKIRLNGWYVVNGEKYFDWATVNMASETPKKFLVTSNEFENNGNMDWSALPYDVHELETTDREEAIAYIKKERKQYEDWGYTINPNDYEISDYVSLSGKKAIGKKREIGMFDGNGDFEEDEELSALCFIAYDLSIHPLEALLQEFKITRYALSKHEIPESTISSIISRKVAVDNLQIGTIMKIANALDLGLEETYARLKGYE